jgi:ribosome recycling factor
MSVQAILSETESKMKHAIEAMVHDFSTLRTGRANPNVLERVHVEYYGSEVPINQIANISVPEPRQLLIQPYEKNMTPVIERAIMKSDIGINPVNDGTGIRLNFPQMTEDRRKEMVKTVNSRSEQCAVSIRNVRRDANEQIKALEKKKEISEDDVRGHEATIQKLTDRYIEESHKLRDQKDAELMKV